MNNEIQQFHQLVKSQDSHNLLLAGELLGTSIHWEMLTDVMKRDFVQLAFIEVLRAEKDENTLLQVWSWVKKNPVLIPYIQQDFSIELREKVFYNNIKTIKTCVQIGFQETFREALCNIVVSSSFSHQPIFKELFEIPFLEQLALNFNQISSLPHELAQLQHLINLDISYNNFTTLPYPIAKLSKLRYLLTIHNQLTILPAWLAQLPKLQVLNLAGNPIHTFPSWASTSLEILNLLDNKIAAMPKMMGTWTSLKTLNLSNNLIKSVDDWILNFPKLEYLHIHHLQIDDFSEHITQLKHLKEIHVFEGSTSLATQQLWAKRLPKVEISYLPF